MEVKALTPPRRLTEAEVWVTIAELSTVPLPPAAESDGGQTLRSTRPAVRSPMHEINLLARRALDEQCSAQFPLRTQCIRVSGRAGGKDVTILLDGGSNQSYVRADVAQAAVAEWYSDEEQDLVTIASGRMEDTRIRHVDIEVAFGEYAKRLHLKVVDALLHNVILGQDWMDEVDPHINHRHHTVDISWGGKQFTVKSMDWTPDVRVYSAKHAIRALRLGNASYAAVLQVQRTETRVAQASILGQVPTQPYSQDLAELMEAFQDVFKELSGLPPRRSVDHAIDIVLGSKPVARPPSDWLQLRVPKFSNSWIACWSGGDRTDGFSLCCSSPCGQAQARETLHVHRLPRTECGDHQE